MPKYEEIAGSGRIKVTSRAAAKRAAEKRGFTNASTRPPSWSEWTASRYGWGGYLSPEGALGLPAAARAISLISETIASLPIRVFEGEGADKRERADSWQSRLLKELPGMGDFTVFDVISDIAASLEACGNAFVQKVIADGEVVSLIVIDPMRVEVKREKGEKRFYVTADGKRTEYTSATILHIRGFTVSGSDMGLSPITLHRTALSQMTGQDEYLQRFYAQGMGSRVAIETTETPSQEEAQALLDRIKANHAGIENSWVPLLLTNGATAKSLTMSLEDAQFVESSRLNLTQAAHIFRVPPKFLTGEGDLTEWDFIALHQLSIAPRLKRITAALHTDADLFPDRALYPEFDVRELARTDAKTKAEVEHMQIQDGTLLPDEKRADEGKPPLPPIPEDPSQTPGMVPQLTPVGGAPNPNADTP